MRALPLLGNAGAASHDWWNILGATGQLEASRFYGDLWFLLGMVLILLSYAWSVTLFYIELLGRGVIADHHGERKRPGSTGEQ